MHITSKKGYERTLNVVVEKNSIGYGNTDESLELQLKD